MIIEILPFEGCPNSRPVRRTLRRICAALGVQADVREINVPDLETAQRLRFLAAPAYSRRWSRFRLRFASRRR